MQSRSCTRSPTTSASTTTACTSSATDDHPWVSAGGPPVLGSNPWAGQAREGVPMSTKVAIVTGASAGIGEATAAPCAPSARRCTPAPAASTGWSRWPTRGPSSLPGRHRRRLDGRRRAEVLAAEGRVDVARQQRRLRLVRRARGRADRRGAAAVRGERVRPRAHDPAGAADDARAARGLRREHLLDRRQDLGAPRFLVPRDEVRGRGPERLPAHGAEAARRPRRGHRARRHRDRVARHLGGACRWAPRGTVRTRRRPLP